MTTRQLRRAAERTARQQDRKATAPNEIPSDFPPPTRAAINKANAQFSTGPKTGEGKATSSQNALKTALTGRTVLLPTDDAERYGRHLAAYSQSFSPLGIRECELVQALADAAWRLDRIPGLEEAIYCQGCAEFAGQVTETDPQARLTMLRMHTLLAYERQLRNLHTQEARLHRMREKLQVELKQLQSERIQSGQASLHAAALLYRAAQREAKPFHPAELGFEFSIRDIEAYLQRVNSAPQSQIGLPPSMLAKKEHSWAA